MQIKNLKEKLMDQLETLVMEQKHFITEEDKSDVI